MLAKFRSKLTPEARRRPSPITSIDFHSKRRASDPRPVYLEDQRRIPRMPDALRNDGTLSVRLNRTLWMIESVPSGDMNTMALITSLMSSIVVVLALLSGLLKVGELNPVWTVMM